MSTHISFVSIRSTEQMALQSMNNNNLTEWNNADKYDIQKRLIFDTIFESERKYLCPIKIKLYLSAENGDKFIVILLFAL